MSYDQITMSGIEVFAYHGVYDTERQRGQRFVVDITLFLSAETTHRAARSDQLGDTTDYDAVIARVVEIVQAEPVALLETLAERLCWTLMSEGYAPGARVTIHKPEPSFAVPVSDVSVTITRGVTGSAHE